MTTPQKEELLGMAVYRAVDDDLWDLVAGGELMHAESPVFRDVPFVKREAAAFVYSHIHDDNKCCFLAKNEMGICGAMLGMAVPAMMGLELHAHEEILYALPQERGESAGKKLMEAFIHWGEAKGCKRFWTGSSTGIDTKGYNQLIDQFGFKKAGEVFYKHG